MTTEYEKSWWYPERVGPELAARLRKDLQEPEDSHLNDAGILAKYEYEGKYATLWDHTGEAQEQFDPLADAFFQQQARIAELEAEVERLKQGLENIRDGCCTCMQSRENCWCEVKHARAVLRQEAANNQPTASQSPNLSGFEAADGA